MRQQIIALLVILFFLTRLFIQKKKGRVRGNEFRLWLSFWLLAGLAIIFIKDIDHILRVFGFSLSGINFLLYLAVLALFYFVFRLRLTLAKLDQDLTEIARQVALKREK